jgi:hypothetical protein
MSETPTYASLIRRLFSPDSLTNREAEREAVIEHLLSHEADRIAAETEVRDRLRDSIPGVRLVAAEVVHRVYGDAPAAADTLAGLIRQDVRVIALDLAGPLLRLPAKLAAPLLELLVRHAPYAFGLSGNDFCQWAGFTAIRAGVEGMRIWQELIVSTSSEIHMHLVVGLARAAPLVDHDPSPLENTLRQLGVDAASRTVTGAALWRITWRVDRAWLDSIDPRAELFQKDVGIARLVLEVLIEHLGRRRDLAALLRDLLQCVPSGVAREMLSTRLVPLGPVGWNIVLPLLTPGQREDIRMAIYSEALRCRDVLPLVQRSAHGVIAEASRSGVPQESLGTALEVLASLGRASSSAVPELLGLIRQVPAVADAAARTLVQVAAGHDTTVREIVFTVQACMNQLPGTRVPAVRALGDALAILDADAPPRMIDNVSVDTQAIRLLLEHDHWMQAPLETRMRHARMIAEHLGNAEGEVRLRAAGFLRYYRNALTEVWPALVAALLGHDDQVAVTILPCFRSLRSSPAIDELSAELVECFREPYPAHAARAVIALERLGRFSWLAAELRAAVEKAGEDETAWGWQVLRAAVKQVGQGHGFHRDIEELFAGSPEAIAARVAALMTCEESPPVEHFEACLPKAGVPSGVDWNTLHQSIVNDRFGQCLVLAVMCEFGSTGFARHKIWLIKGQRLLCNCGLAEAKRACEEVIELMAQSDQNRDRRLAVRTFFVGRTTLPREIEEMLQHPRSWYRWAGLVLAEAWGLAAEEAEELLEDRTWDRIPFVRERALRVRTTASQAHR